VGDPREIQYLDRDLAKKLIVSDVSFAKEKLVLEQELATPGTRNMEDRIPDFHLNENAPWRAPANRVAESDHKGNCKLLLSQSLLKR